MSQMVVVKPGVKPWLAASKDESRPSLQAVYLEPNGTAWATDGQIAVVVPAFLDLAPSRRLAFPAEALGKLVEAVRKTEGRYGETKLVLFEQDDVGEGKRPCLSNLDGTITVFVVDEVAPALGRILTHRLGAANGPRHVIQPRLVARIGQVMGYQMNGAKPDQPEGTVLIWPETIKSGEPIVIQGTAGAGRDVLAILMPMGEVDEDPLAWLKGVAPLLSDDSHPGPGNICQVPAAEAAEVVETKES